MYLCNCIILLDKLETFNETYLKKVSYKNARGWGSSTPFPRPPHWLLPLRVSWWSSSPTQSPNAEGSQESALSNQSQSLGPIHFHDFRSIIEAYVPKISILTFLQNLNLSTLISTWLPHGWLEFMSNSTCLRQNSWYSSPLNLLSSTFFPISGESVLLLFRPRTLKSSLTSFFLSSYFQSISR